MMDSKEKETQNLENVKEQGIDQKSESMVSNDTSEEKPDLFRKISEAIPQRHVKKVICFFMVIIVLGLALNIYSTFWGNPEVRAKLKEKIAETEMLQKQLDQQRQGVDVSASSLEVGNEHSNTSFDSLDNKTSKDELFSAYENAVDIVGEESN